MTRSHPYPVRLRLQLAEIARSTAGTQDRAAAVLESMGRALPFDAAWLAVRDPEQRRHIPVATRGPIEPLRRYFSTPEADSEVEQLGLNRRRPPMLASEIPAPLPELRAWGEHLLPAGFRGGLAVGLFTPAGRHVGFLSLLTEDPGRLDSVDRRLVGTVRGIVAHGLDRTREMADAARIVRSAEAGVVLTRGGDVLPLPGRPGHRLLEAGSPTLAAAADELAYGGTICSFLAPTTALDDPAGLLRVSVVNCSRPELDHLMAAVLLSPPGDLRGLTPRDLRVLGLLATGVTRRRALGARLGLDDRQVADALAAGQAALHARGLPATATYAIRTGLRIPPRLSDPG